MEFINGELQGIGLVKKTTQIGDLTYLFANENQRSAMPQDTIVYDVQAYLPVEEGTLGGLFFGTTKLYPGKVGEEYFMTRGHFHALSDRAEYYWGIRGVGKLILMDRDRKIWTENMYAGSLHYIPAHTAHRVANTGHDTLLFGACWPADAGHNYREIEEKGFSGRLLDIDGVPTLIPAS